MLYFRFMPISSAETQVIGLTRAVAPNVESEGVLKIKPPEIFTTSCAGLDLVTLDLGDPSLGKIELGPQLY